MYPGNLGALNKSLQDNSFSILTLTQIAAKIVSKIASNIASVNGP